MGRIFLLFLVFGIIFLVIPSIIMTSNTPEAVQANAVQLQTAAGICGSVYTVLAGDTISLISQKCGLTTAAVQAANPALQRPYWIYPGQQISLPGVSGPGIPNTGGDSYTIVSGDTLYAIARRNNTTVQNLLNLNPSITNADLIFPGTVIRIR